jgi:outer membrane protein assembly factor BamB
MMKNNVICLLLLAVPAAAQFGRGDGTWSTAGGDAQRSSWVRTDPKISSTSMQKPGFGLAWKVKLGNDLTSVSLLDRYIGYRGFRSLGFVSGGGDRLFALDTDLGRIEWQKKLSANPAASGDCPGSVTRPVTTAFPAAPGGRGGGGGGRGNAAKSGVGDPDQGAVTIAELEARAAAARAGAPPAGGRGGRGPGGPPRRMPNYIHTVSSDGVFHSLWVSNGEEPETAPPFLPAGSSVHGLIVVSNFAYAAAGQGCTAAPNAVFAMDLESKKVASWKAASGDLAGAETPAFGPDGTLYVATTGGEVVALEAKTLAVKSSYTGGKPGFVSSPVILPYKDKTLLAAVAKDGRIHLLDAASLQSAVTQTPASGDASGSAAMAAWQDPSGTPWLLAPTAGAVVAWKVVDQGGTLSLERGWTSRDLMSPLKPMIVNGVVFAVSSGEQRGQRAVPAVLYALDGMTGKELWNSGKIMTASVHGAELSGGSSQLYLGTSDGMLYAFAFPIEH